MTTTLAPSPRTLAAIATMRRIRNGDRDAAAEAEAARATRAERRAHGYRGPLTRAEAARRAQHAH